MSPHKIESLPSRSALSAYGISSNGFLPEDEPLKTLPNHYYQPWEDLVAELPKLVQTQTLRERIKSLPVLSTLHLKDESEWQRAFLVLSVLAQGYIWQGPKPSERIVPAISIPLLQAASHLDMQPIASYAALNLWNWRALPSQKDLCKPESMESLITFTGTDDESWFFVVSNAMEARAGPLLATMLSAIEAADLNDAPSVISGLFFLKESLLDIGRLLDRMEERCRPRVFYHAIRPMLAGSLNDNLPQGVFYDEGNGKGSWRKYRGGSNGQSSLIQFFDTVLGVVHEKTGNFHEEMRGYMPGLHAKFLKDVGEIANIRQYVESNAENSKLQAAFNEAVSSLSLFRDKHIRLATRYVILPSRSSSNSECSQAETRANNLKRRYAEGSRSELVGTGGTALVPFLRQSRDETKATAVHLD